MRPNRRLHPTLALALAVLAAPSLAQDDEPRHPPIVPESTGQSDAQAELRGLFRKVERTLRRIDIHLSDAAAGDVPLTLPDDSGLADLLRDAQGRSQRAVRDIDKILEIATRSSQGQSGGQPQQQQQPPPGESPLDQPRNQRPQAPEPTPELPGDPRPEDEKSADENGSPESPEASDDDPENKENEAPPESAKGQGQDDTGDSARWGELPSRVREVFRNQGGGELPVQYRDWIDSYYRRLNQRR